MVAHERIGPGDFRRLLARSVALPVTLMAALAGAFLLQIVYLISVSRWVEHTDRVIADAIALQKVLVDGETGLRGYLLTSVLEFLEPYDQEERDAGPAFESL